MGIGVFESNEMTPVTSSFLSQYTTTTSSTLTRRKSITPTTCPSATDDIHYSTKVFDKKSLSIIMNWELNPWEYNTLQLVDFVLDIFHYYDVCTFYRIPLSTLLRFIRSVQQQYQEIPYHNFNHAFTTLHVSFLILSAQSSIEERGNNTSFFSTRDIFSILVAAYCHDMNHNGRTNDFHIRSRTSTALLYNDQSVLENMHAAACFETMRRPGHNLLENVNTTEYAHIRKSILRAILATDMHNHANMVSQLHEKLKPDVFQPDEDSHKELLINAIVHAADISGPALIEKLHVKWSLQLLLEFNMQYEEECALGMIPTPFMNAKPGSVEIGTLNITFIDSCVFPLWNVMNSFLKGLETCIENIHANRNVWNTMIASANTNEQA